MEDGHDDKEEQGGAVLNSEKSRHERRFGEYVSLLVFRLECHAQQCGSH
jgi:hypothetical protein